MGKTREMLSDELIYLYNNGKLYHAYRTFGAHIEDGGAQFTVWAPDVKAVRVPGDFNGWNEWDEAACLSQIGETGIYTGFIPGAKAGDCYKYDIELYDGRHILKADPFAFGAELRPGTASKVTDLSYRWKDSSWMKKRSQTDLFTSPMKNSSCLT